MHSDNLFNITARAQGPQSDFANLTLYDGKLNTVASGYGYIESQVSPGLYKLVTKLNESYTEKYVEVKQNIYEVVDIPKTASSFVADSFKNTHEYYSEQANRYINETTADLGFPNQFESLFMFFRYPSAEVFTEMHYAGQRLTDRFVLLDDRRQILTEFTSKAVKEDTQEYGWMAFHAKLRPGLYYLYYRGRKAVKKWNEKAGQPAREIPIYIFEKWQTQCYMTFGKGPMFPSMTLSMREANPPYEDKFTTEHDLEYLEGILQKLRNGIYYLPKDTLINLAYEKFKNPIMGLLAAYCYFRSKEHDDEQFFTIVVNNLKKLFGSDSADMAALQLLAAQRFNIIQQGQRSAIATPCFFMPLINYLIQADTDINSPLIIPGSPAEKAIRGLYYDMIWTSYKPFSRLKEPWSRSTHKIQGDKNISLNFPTFSLLHSGKGSAIQSLNPRPPGRIPTFPRSAPKPNPAKVSKPAVMNSWMANAIMAEMGKNKDLPSLPDVALSTRITLSLLIDTLDTLLKNSDRILLYLQAHPESSETQIFTASNLDKAKQLRSDAPMPL